VAGRSPTDIVSDLIVSVVGGVLYAFLAWAFWAIVSRYNLPLWVNIALSAAVAIALIAVVGYVWHTRAIKQVQSSLTRLQVANEGLTRELATTRDALYAVRETNRLVGEQLSSHIQPESLSYVTRYIVNPDGLDVIETDWHVAFPSGEAGCVFFIEEWSSFPVDGVIRCECQSPQPGTTAIPVILVDEPTHQKHAVYLAPLVGNGGRTVQVQHHWPNLWKGLRDRGSDYIEVSARKALKQAKIEVEISAQLGLFEWEPTTDQRIKLDVSTKGGRRILEMLVASPVHGENYKANIKKASATPRHP
jgi:hypothetical protein